MYFLRFALMAVGLCFVLACAEPATSVQELSAEEVDDLVQPDGKFDTGYYSSMATELEGRFSSFIELDLSELSEEDRLDRLGKYQSDEQAISLLVDQQIKLAKGQLVDQKLHLNLTSGDVSVDEITLEGSILRIRYRVQAESVVTYDELQDDGLRVADIVGKRVDLQIALDPRSLFSRSGENCAAGHEPGSLGDHNYFYYFRPDLESCTVPMATGAFFEVQSLLPAASTYPEYDKLVADGRVEVAIFFGKAEDEIHGGDWGVMMWRAFEVNLRLRGFEKVEGLEAGQRYERMRGGLVEMVDLVSPWDLVELGDDAVPLFAQMFRDHEIVMYNGHSFYGSLDILDDPANYPSETYQILFMNSCWSYEYYTKQVFQNKETEDDP